MLPPRLDATGVKPAPIGGAPPVRAISPAPAAIPVSDARQAAFQRALSGMVGQTMQGEVLSKYDDGSYLVRVAGNAARMQLPGGAQVGAEVPLTLIATTPRPTFQVGTGAPGTHTAQLYTESGLPPGDAPDTPAAQPRLPSQDTATLPGRQPGQSAPGAGTSGGAGQGGAGPAGSLPGQAGGAPSGAALPGQPAPALLPGQAGAAPGLAGQAGSATGLPGQTAAAPGPDGEAGAGAADEANGPLAGRAGAGTAGNAAGAGGAQSAAAAQARAGLAAQAGNAALQTQARTLAQSAQTAAQAGAAYPGAQVQVRPHSLAATLLGRAPLTPADQLPELGRDAPTAALSQAARTIASALATAYGAPGVPATINGKTPLVSSGVPDAEQLSHSLKNALGESGLFYESHVAEWAEGKRPLQELMREPQNQRAQAPGQQGGPQTSESLARAALASPDLSAAQMINQQLHAHEQQRVQWNGQAWPGQPMQWEVQREQREGSQQGQEEGGGEAVWRSGVRFRLPLLGKISASVTLVGEQVHIQVQTDDGASADTLRAWSGQLQLAMEAAGSPLSSLTISQESAPAAPGAGHAE